jgi:hypothetical protein
MASLSVPPIAKKIDTNPNPAALPPSYGRAVAAGLVDKSFQEAVRKHRFPRIASFPSPVDNFFGHASVEALRSVGPVTAKKLAGMRCGTVTAFAHSKVDFAKHFDHGTAATLTNLRTALAQIFVGNPAPKPNIAGTAGLDARQAATYRDVVQSEVTKMKGTMMIALMTADASHAMTNMIAAAEQLIGQGNGPELVPATVDFAKYNAVVDAKVKSIRDMLMHARFTEGAHRAWNDLVAAFESVKK